MREEGRRGAQSVGRMSHTDGVGVGISELYLANNYPLPLLLELVVKGSPIMVLDSGFPRT